MKKVFFNSPLEDFDYKKYVNGKTFYILPSENSINSKIRSELTRGVNIVDTEFMTFDNISKFKKVREVDEVVKFIVLKRILIRNFKGKKIFDESVDIILEFFDELLRSGKRRGDVEKFSSPVVKSLADSFEEFYNYFEKKGYCLTGSLSKIEVDELNAKTIIIDGFVNFRFYELDFIRRISKDIDVIINIPFNVCGINVIKNTLKDLKDFGFEIIIGDSWNYKNISKPKDIKVLNSKDNFYNMFFVNIKKDISNKNEKIDIITGSRELGLLINDRSKFHGLDFNMDIMERSRIKEELITVLDFLEDKSKENSLKRLRLSYFKIPIEKYMLEEDLLKQNFSNILDIKLDKITEIEIPTHHLKNYLDGVKFLQDESIRQSSDLDYYCDFFIDYLGDLEEGIEDRFNKEIYDYIYIRDRNFLNKVLEILENMKRLSEFYDEISYREFKSLFKKYIENIKFKAMQNRESIDLKSLNFMYYQDLNKLYLIGFDSHYESTKERNFLYSGKTIDELKEFKIRNDDIEIELLELIYAVLNSKEVVILIDDKEKGMSKNLNLINKIFNLDINNYVSAYYSSDIEISNDRHNISYELSKGTIEKLNLKLKDRIYSATDFDVLKECPRRFLFERIFKLEEFALEYDDKFYLKMGDRFHNILEKYFKIEKSKLDEDLLKKLTLRESFGHKNFDELKFLEKIQIINDFNFLKEYIECDLEDQKSDDLVPKYFEKPFELKINDIKIRGRIDRIDSNGDEEAIIDYKRGSAISKSKILNKEAFQIPIYALARLSEGKKFVKASYGVIKNGEVVTVLKNSDLREKNGKVRYFYSQEELENIFNGSKEEIVRLVESVKSADFDSNSKCDKCIYTDICENKWGKYG